MSSGSRIVERMSRREMAVVILLAISGLINYIDRSNLSIAAPVLEKQLSLSPLQIGSLLAAFSWTYALLQLVGVSGWLTDRFPVSLVMLWGFVVWSVATIATGLVSGFALLFMARLLLGAGESIAYPCYSRIFADLPQEHRGRANALIRRRNKAGADDWDAHRRIPAGPFRLENALHRARRGRSGVADSVDHIHAPNPPRKGCDDIRSHSFNIGVAAFERSVGRFFGPLLRQLFLLLPARMAALLSRTRGEAAAWHDGSSHLVRFLRRGEFNDLDWLALRPSYRSRRIPDADSEERLWWVVSPSLLA